MTIFIITLAFIAGIIWGLYLKISIAPFLILLLILAILFKIKNKTLIILFIIFCFISNLYISKLEDGYENKYKDILGDVTIVGTIVSNAEEKQYNYQYKIKVEELKYEGIEQKRCKETYILLKVKKDKGKSIIYNYGDKVSLVGEFELAQSRRNLGGFDYREYLKTKSIYGIVTTKNTQLNLIKTNNENIINMLANKVAKQIKENIENILPEEQSNLLIGILIGNKDGLSEEIKENFKNSNLSHMLAISGAHVSYVILGITFMLSKIKIGKRSSRIFIILFLIFFTILTGATPSVQRASIMAIYILIANLLYKKPNILISISLSMLILLVQNPYNLFDVGFQLSYGGTLGIIFFNKKIKFRDLKIKILQKIKEMMIVTLSANIVILPIMMLHYNTLSLTFFVSNILASPILAIVIILGFIVVLLSFILNPISMILGKVLSVFLELLMYIANFSSKLPFSKIYVVTPNILQIILYYYAILNRRNFFKVCIIVTLIVTLVFPNITTFSGNFKIYFIDVGQGDSTLVVTPNNKSILIDGGGSKDTETFDVGKNTLLPYLLNRRINNIDYLIISHFDTDHCRTVY